MEILNTKSKGWKKTLTSDISFGSIIECCCDYIEFQDSIFYKASNCSLV